MSNIFESSDLFEASIRFENAAVLLAELADNPSEIDDQERETLKWAGELLETADWDNARNRTNRVSPSVASAATSIRPFFYNVLLDTRDDFKKANLTDQTAMRTFFSNLYDLLSGSRRADEIQLDLRLASVFLHKLSDGLLVEVSGNGHPHMGSGILAFGL